MRLCILLLIAFAQSPLCYGLSAYISGHNETCGHHNGTLTVHISGGVPPYQCQWSTGATTLSIASLDEGLYSVLVTDSEGTEVTVHNEVHDVPYLETQFLGWTPAGGLPCPDECNGRFSIPLEGLNGIQPYGLAVSYGSVEDPTYPHPLFAGVCDEVPVVVTITDALGCVGSFEVNEDGPEGLPIVIHDINPACNGQANGSVVLSLPQEYAFDPAYEVIVTNTTTSEIFLWNSFGWEDVELPLQDLSVGHYDVQQSYMLVIEDCPRHYSFDIVEIAGDCGTVQGDVWYDADGDCVHDASEVMIPYSVQEIGPGSAYVITNSNGHYSYNLADGAYSIAPVDPTLTPLCQPVLPIPFAIASNTVTVDMAAWSETPLDLLVQANASEARPGFDQTIWADVVNVSPQAAGPITLVCTLSAELDYLSATPEPTTVDGNTLTWQFAGLGSFGAHHFTVHAHLPSSVFLGTPVSTLFDGTSTSGEADMDNNQCLIDQVAIGAFDPNYKEALTSTRRSSSSYFIEEDEWVDYTIHFQNTGTASAINVTVVDTLPVELDMATFVQGVGSHEFEVAFKPGRVVEWSFLDIQLPDSGSNEPASHGAVGFRIRPRAPVLPGTTISNTAAIHFDFNDLVITAPCVLVAESSTGMRASSDDLFTLSPNPAKDRLTLLAVVDPGVYTMEILSADGRSVHRAVGVGQRSEVDIDRLSSGAYTLCLRTAAGVRNFARFVKD